MIMRKIMQECPRKKNTPSTVETIVSFWRLITISVVLVCVLTPAVFAQEEIEFEEREELQELQELEEIHREVEELFTPDREKFLAIEFPAAITLLKKYRNAAESETAKMETKWKQLEFQRDLAYMADELREEKKYRPEHYPKAKQFYQLDLRARTCRHLPRNDEIRRS